MSEEQFQTQLLVKLSKIEEKLAELSEYTPELFTEEELEGRNDDEDSE